MMGVDPAQLSFRHYQAILGEWNLRHDPEGKQGPPKDYSRLRRAMEAHTVH